MFILSTSVSRLSTLRRLEGHPVQVRHKHAGGLFFYYPRLLYWLNQMLTLMLLNHHQVSLFKIIRPLAPCGTRCMGHDIRTCPIHRAPHGTLLERDLQFVQRRRTCNSVKEQDSICAWTNGIVQHSLSQTNFYLFRLKK